MKQKMNQLFKDKLLLVMLVLGLLTIVAAAGAVRIQKGNQLNEENPYLNVEEQNNVIAQEQVKETKVQVAGNSNATNEVNETTQADVIQETQIADNSGIYEGEIEEPIAQVGADKEAATALVLDFADTTKLSWPVPGNVVLDYSMESTIYFPTLDQYKCNPAVVIQSDVSTPVIAPSNARVLSIGSNEEIGNYVELDLGNNYTAICGQLKEVQVVENEYIYQGHVLGYVAEPTKYYSIEGNNLYFKLTQNGQAVDVLDYME